MTTYQERLTAEAFATFTTRDAALVLAAVHLDELDSSIPRGPRRGIAAAVIRDLWPSVTWRQISEAVGYRTPALIVALQAAKHARSVAADAVRLVEVLVREAVMDNYLSIRPLILEELEMLTEVGYLVRAGDGYRRAS